MSARGAEFADRWVAENINAEAYAPDGDDSRARELADVMVAEAKAGGITPAEIEEEKGDLVDFISSALAAATDAEVRRLSDKDG
jgi:hypothetical protein